MNSLIHFCAVLLLGAPGGEEGTSMPVREITVFKDGHAFVLHEGEMPVDENGDVSLEELPRPVLGTFWPYAAEPGAELVGVVAGKRKVTVERPALGMAELLRANLGATVTIRERSGKESTSVVASSRSQS